MNIKAEERRAKTIRNLADCLYYDDRFRDAEEAYRMELAIEEKLARLTPGKYEIDIALTHNCVGASLSKRGLEMRARKEFLKALGITEKFTNEQYYRSISLIKTIYCNLIGTYVSLNCFEEAIRYEFKCLTLKEDEPEEHSNSWSIISARATSYWALGVLYDQVGFRRCSERMKCLERLTNDEIEGVKKRI